MRKLLIATICCVLLTACSSPSSGPSVATAGSGTATPSASAAAGKAEANRQFAKCMREHGVDVPDPGPDGNLQFDANAAGDRNKAVQATSACQQYLPNGGDLKNLSPEQLELARAFAKCMREHGIDMPDPDPNSGVAGILKGNIDFNSPQFKSATEACKSTVKR
ncbi:hypothetical protein AB0M46_15510 [Dactylosporangium sp. NPDC051485]|uniref:hypothetical protein n=1 Tax=Dactylosporangium sp. NPDC051485 TaxID=3154846 RepID=UPI003446B97C